MRQLVRDQRHTAFVAGDCHRSYKRKSRVFHAAKRKTWWQDQQVIAIPPIRAIQSLALEQHGLGILELPGCGIKHRWLCINAGSFAHRLERDIANGNRHQVRRDRLRHPKLVIPVTIRVGVVFGAHDGGQASRRPDMRRVGKPNLGGVLQRNPAAGVVCLRL